VSEIYGKVNFINIILTAFMHTDPKSAKILSSCKSFLCFWDLRALKPLVVHCWNWLQVVCRFLWSKANIVISEFFMTSSHFSYPFAYFLQYPICCELLTRDKTTENAWEDEMTIWRDWHWERKMTECTNDANYSGHQILRPFCITSKSNLRELGD